MERLHLILANFSTFALYFTDRLFNNRFVNLIWYNLFDIVPEFPQLVRNLNNQQWLWGYNQRRVGWTLVGRHHRWNFWIFRIEGYALCCTYHNGRLLRISNIREYN
jgi:hypothetical protein